MRRRWRRRTSAQHPQSISICKGCSPNTVLHVCNFHFLFILVVVFIRLLFHFTVVLTVICLRVMRMPSGDDSSSQRSKQHSAAWISCARAPLGEGMTEVWQVTLSDWFLQHFNAMAFCAQLAAYFGALVWSAFLLSLQGASGPSLHSLPPTYIYIYIVNTLSLIAELIEIPKEKNRYILKNKISSQRAFTTCL